VAEGGVGRGGVGTRGEALTTAGRKQLEAEEASYERLTWAIRLVLRAAN